MAAHGIDSQPTAADDHHQVGQGEKAVDLLKTMARAWLEDLKLDDSFFAHAVMHAAQILNRTPSASLDWRIPFTIATGSRPDNVNIGVFGARCFSHVPAGERTKLESRGAEATYLGLDPDRHGAAEPAHIVLRHGTDQIVSSRSVIFDHDRIAQDSLTARAFAASDMPHYGGATPKDPRNRRDMLDGPHAAEFILGEQDEITSLWELGCWERVAARDIPPGTEVLPTTWSYRYKLDPVTGEIKRFKARFCVRGDRERDDPVRFSAQVQLNHLRLLLALHGFGVLSHFAVFDVGNAYANTPQARRVYICQPPGYADDSGDVLMLLIVGDLRVKKSSAPGPGGPRAEKPRSTAPAFLGGRGPADPGASRRRSAAHPLRPRGVRRSVRVAPRTIVPTRAHRQDASTHRA